MLGAGRVGLSPYTAQCEVFRVLWRNTHALRDDINDKVNQSLSHARHLSSFEARSREVVGKDPATFSGDLRQLCLSECRDPSQIRGLIREWQGWGTVGLRTVLGRAKLCHRPSGSCLVG
jgi:hypothetical protein